MGMFASFDDVALRYLEGTLSLTKEDWVEAKIDDAEGKLTALIPSLLDPTKTSPSRLANAKSAVCEAVLRVYRNPGGFRSEGMETDNASRSTVTESGLLYFTPDELASVRLRSKKRGLGTIKVGAWNATRNVRDAVAASDWPRDPYPPFGDW
jgi:hypothetical protein